jgi:PEP-CTERM motif
LGGAGNCKQYLDLKVIKILYCVKPDPSFTRGRTVKVKLFMVFASTALLLSGPVKAGFSGNVLDADYLAPTSLSVLDTMSNQVVGGGVEWLNIPIVDFSVDVSDTSILFFRGGSLSFSPSPFNGLRFIDANGTIDDIVGVTVGSNSLSGSPIITFDANTIFVNFTGLSTPAPFSTTINVEFAAPVPEPEIYAMLGMGLGLLGWVGRRKKLHSGEQLWPYPGYVS